MHVSVLGEQDLCVLNSALSRDTRTSLGVQVIRHVLKGDHTATPASLTFSHEAFTAQPQSIIALCPVYIPRPAEDRRLS